MPEEAEVGCERPAGGPTDQEQKKQVESVQPIREERSMIKVGQKAPDFTAPGYQQGKFVNVRLSDYIGKWVVLCFYPGDFTFV